MQVIFLALLSTLALASPQLIGGREALELEFRSTVFVDESCTGVKIGPKTFLFASHCLVLSSTAEFKTQFRPDSKIRLRTHYKLNRKVTIVEAHAHSSYMDEVRSRLNSPLPSAGVGLVAFDIALFIIAEETPEIPVAQIDLDPVRDNERVIIGGFGCQNAQVTDKVREYKISPSRVIPASMVKQDYYKRDLSLAPDFNFYSAGKVLDSNSASICAGDSGGPVYREHSQTLVGVNSQYIFQDRSGVSFVNTHSRVSEVYDWIQTLVQ